MYILVEKPISGRYCNYKRCGYFPDRCHPNKGCVLLCTNEEYPAFITCYNEKAKIDDESISSLIKETVKIKDEKIRAYLKGVIKRRL